MGAVIDSNSFRTQKEAIEEAKADPDSDVLVGGDVADDEGYFVAPTVVETRNPNFRLLRDELFGPVVTAYVYPDDEWQDTLDVIDGGSPFGLTGAIFSRERAAIEKRGTSSSTPPATCTSTTSRQVPSSANGPSGARARPGRTTRRAAVEPHPLGLAADDQGNLRSMRDHRYPFMDPDTAGT